MSRLLQRVAVGVAVAVGALLGATVLELDPDPVPVVLLALLAVAGLSVVVDGVPRRHVGWFPSAVRNPVVEGRDGATKAMLRLLENHRTSRHPDPAVRDRLAALADRTLAVRHQSHLDAPLARELLGDDTVDLLQGPVVRLSPRRIDRVLRTIEEL